jgi:hypothetical protein
MLLQINGRNIQDCKESDFDILIDNVDYRENDYIEYKRNFAFLEMDKGKKRDVEKVEFKVDVCSFANADGGYIIFGISDKNGCAKSITGIEIEDGNTDRFELDRRNDLNGIQPKIPQVSFCFIELKSGKYVVVMHIEHDGYAPYVYLEGEKNYMAYRRYGNGKKAIPYVELRQMFNQSMELGQSIQKCVLDRISHYRGNAEICEKRFVHIMFIPETFMDYRYKKNMFFLHRSGKASFQGIFSSFRCYDFSMPCVDGVRFSSSDVENRSVGYVKDNGIVEVYSSLDDLLKYDENNNLLFLSWGVLWKEIYDTCINYRKSFLNINTGERIFICLSIVGCTGVVTDGAELFSNRYGFIDREIVNIEPIEVHTIDNNEEYSDIMNRLHLLYLLSIGVQSESILDKLINA